jgi:hypothetical protein
MDENLAYDGSNSPQRRELTARERDIISRIMADAMYTPARDQSQDAKIRIFENEFYDYSRIKEALDPRRLDNGRD